MLRSLLFVLFFLSGCAALIYQVVWERMLFTVLGVDLQSITIIVSVFMFGLGIGGLLGGVIADWKPRKLLLCYVIIEFSIALFGYFSPSIIAFLSLHLPATNLFITVLVSFIVLLIPTLLMGATFPILVKQVNFINKNIGRSVGSLYFANTLGGAVGAYLSGFVFLYWMNLNGEIIQAVLLNLISGTTAFLVFRREI